MNIMKALGLVGVAVSALIATQAFATTCPVAPVAAAGQMQGSPVCIAPYGWDGSKSGLSSILSPYDKNSNPNGVFTAGSPSVNPYTQQAQKPFWSVAGSSGSVSTILLQIAGMANGYTFGIFDPGNESNRLAIFTGGTDGKQAMLSVFTGGGYGVNDFSGIPQATFGKSNYFGFFLTTPDGDTFYSLPSLNGDGTAHMVAYQGNDTGHIRDMHGLYGGLWQSSEYIQAWEDLPAGRSDMDYNDFVVLVESIHPNTVPEPAALRMFGLGVLLIGGFSVLRRRSYKLNA